MFRSRIAATIAFLLVTSSHIVWAQDEPEFLGSVEVASYKAAKVRKLAVSIAYAGFDGARGVFTAPQGKAFLVLHLELKPTFSKNAAGEDVSYANPSAVTLTARQGQPVWSMGTCDPHGRFSTYASGYSFVPSDEPFVGNFDPVFLIPADATAATLTLGSTKHEVEIPEVMQDQIDPAQAIQIRIDGTKTATELRRSVELGTDDYGAAEFSQQVVTSSGRFALISFILKPKIRNSTTGYFGDPWDFGLLLGKEVYLRPIGVYDGESFGDYASDFYFEQDALGEFNAGKATLVFPLPGAVSNGKLLYLGAPVADVTFGG
jgi:hypothetical protein